MVPISSSKWQKNCEVLNSKQLVFPKMGYSSKKTEVETWNYHPGFCIEETKCGLCTYIHPTKKEVEFPGVFKIEQFEVEFPWVLVFDLIISKGVTQFCRICTGESLFSPEFL